MAIFLLVGGKEVEMLLDHTGKVLDTMARHKLMRSLNQGQKAFASWFPIVKEHTKRCDFTGYHIDKDTWDAILFQTSNIKL